MAINPICWSAYRVAVTKEREWNATGTGDIFRGPGLDTAMGSATATSTTVDVGTLVLDMYDPGAKQLVWTGHVTKTINPSENPEKNQRNIDKAMQAAEELSSEAQIG